MQLPFLRAFLMAATVLLSGCLPQVFEEFYRYTHSKYYIGSTPLLDKMHEISPGNSTRKDVRLLLGEPLYSSLTWNAELYSGFVVVHQPNADRSDPATLLVVYGDGNVVSGVDYQGEGCTGDCRVGDTKGLDMEGLQVLLAPQSESARRLEVDGSRENCTIVVDATNRLLNSYGGYGLYLDERFLQHIIGDGFFRIEVPPDKHLVSCLSVWEQTSRHELTKPGHILVRDDRREPSSLLNEELSFECNAGDIKYFRLVHAPLLGIIQPTGCGIEATNANSFLDSVRNARMVIIPDSVAPEN